jgi:probable phosphoglycerate mutase
MILYLIRHGETEWTEKALLHGRLDSPLSATGVLHARATAAALDGGVFDAIYTSPRGRARQTAEIVARPLGLAPQPLEGLAEADYGWMEGRSLRRWDPDPGDGSRSLGGWLGHVAITLTGERPGRFSQRVQAAFEELAGRHLGQRVVAVTHWGVLSMAMALLLDGDPQTRRRYGPWAACGLSELVLADGRWQAVRLNDQSHLS